jgi:hypothetical protein
LGIGTSSPSAKLNISGTSNTLLLNGSATSANFARFTSTGADGVLGIEAATPAIMTGSTSYATVLYTVGATPLQLGTSSTVRATIDSSGNLGIGTSSPSTYAKLAVFGVQNVATYGNVSAIFSDGTTCSARIQHNSSVVQFSSDGVLAFGTGSSATERARIDSSGNLLVGTTSSAGGSTNTFAVSQTNKSVITVQNDASTTPRGFVSLLPNGGNDTSSYHLICSTLGSDKLFIYGNGNVVNANNSYGSLSDVKLKENIVDATPKLANLMQVKVRNYNLIGDTTKQLGVVAQELEAVFPAMVDESPDRDAEGNVLETKTKSVKYSVFVPMLIKAMQEQQAIIESLKARLDAANL